MPGHRTPSLLVGFPPDWDVRIGKMIAARGFTRPLAEVAVLHHYGVNPKSIAPLLGIGYHTMRGRFRRIHDEYDIKSLTELALIVERTIAPVEGKEHPAD